MSDRHPNQTPLATTTLSQRIALAFGTHSRAIMASVGVLLLGTGVTAFGIAPLAPDAAELPVQRITEPALALPALASLPENHAFTLYRSDTVRRDDTAQSLLARLGVNDASASAFLRSDSTARQLFSARPGKTVTAETNDRHELTRLVARWLPNDERVFHRLIVERTDSGGWSSRLESRELTASARLASGTIRSSLFAATDAANLPDSVAIQIAEIFSSEIDFRR
ncbi:MAG: M23 family peptidase, partial [Hydrogenophaga sp.]|nr:M23 family peptidase [Hydrogenophaga sp.]